VRHTAIDSRDYIVAFTLYSADDCPPDFELNSDVRLDAGLFLPRDDPDWFGRSNYPPRVLLLSGDELTVVAHPSTREPAWRCPLRRLVLFESGHMLLKGWFRFVGNEAEKSLPYNTRGYRAVSRFMRRFRQAWLACGEPPTQTVPPTLPKELDLKFDNALHLELDARETVQAHFYEAPRETRYRRWLLPRQTRTAGELLALTEKRLVWITDRCGDSSARYGTVTASVRRDGTTGAAVVCGDAGPTLEIRLAHGSLWKFAVRADRQADAESFALALQNPKTRNATRGAQPRI